MPNRPSKYSSAPARRRGGGGSSILGALLGTGDIGLDDASIAPAILNTEGGDTITPDQPPAGSTPPRFKSTGNWWQRNLGGGNSLAEQMNNQLLLNNANNQVSLQNQLNFLPAQLAATNKANLAYQGDLSNLEMANLPKKLSIEAQASADKARLMNNAALDQQLALANQSKSLQMQAEDEHVRDIANYLGQNNPITDPLTRQDTPTYYTASNGKSMIYPTYMQEARMLPIGSDVTRSQMDIARNNLASITSNSAIPGTPASVISRQAHEQNMYPLEEEKARLANQVTSNLAGRPFSITPDLIGLPKGSSLGDFGMYAVNPELKDQYGSDFEALKQGKFGVKKIIQGHPASLSPVEVGGNQSSTQSSPAQPTQATGINSTTATYNPNTGVATIKVPTTINGKQLKPGDTVKLPPALWQSYNGGR